MQNLVFLVPGCDQPSLIESDGLPNYTSSVEPESWTHLLQLAARTADNYLPEGQTPRFSEIVNLNKRPLSFRMTCDRVFVMMMLGPSAPTGKDFEHTVSLLQRLDNTPMLLAIGGDGLDRFSDMNLIVKVDAGFCTSLDAAVATLRQRQILL